MSEVRKRFQKALPLLFNSISLREAIIFVENKVNVFYSPSGAAILKKHDHPAGALSQIYLLSYKYFRSAGAIAKCVQSFWKGKIALMCFLICLSANVFAQVSVQTKLDTSYMLIGDQMQLHVAVNSSSNLKSVTALIDQIDTSELVEIIGETEWQNQGNTFLKSYTLTCFDSGYYNLMALPVAYQSDYKSDTVYSNTLALMVDNPQIEEQSDSLQTNLPPADIKGIIEEPTLLEDFYPLLIGLAVLLLLGVLAWYFFFRKEEEVVVEAPVIIRPAHEIALEKLGALQTESLWQNGDVKGYYTKLTFIFREYLENRYDIQALESTTEEVLQQLKKSDFDSEMNSDVTRVLQSADLVKFAKAKPASEFHEESFAKLETIIKKTKEIIQATDPS